MHVNATSPALPCLFILDEHGEANGSVLHFCSFRCLGGFEVEDEGLAEMGQCSDYVGGTLCTGCATDLGSAGQISPADDGLETYRVVALSTAHLTQADIQALGASVDRGDPKVLKRESGFFIKLYRGEYESKNYRHGHSMALKQIIHWALMNGFEMIEFDNSADASDRFPTFDW